VTAARRRDDPACHCIGNARAPVASLRACGKNIRNRNKKTRESAMKVRARSTDHSPARRIDACARESGGSTSRPCACTRHRDASAEPRHPHASRADARAKPSGACARQSGAVATPKTAPSDPPCSASAPMSSSRVRDRRAFGATHTLAIRENRRHAAHRCCANVHSGTRHEREFGESAPGRAVNTA